MRRLAYGGAAGCRTGRCVRVKTAAPRQRKASSSADRRQEGQTRDIDKVIPIVSDKGQAMPKRTSRNPGILGCDGFADPLSLSANLCPVQCGCVIPGQHHVFLDRSRQHMSPLCPPASQLGPEVQLANRGECDAGSFANQMFAVKICPRVALEGERPNVGIEYNSAHGRRLADSSAIS